MTTMKMKALDYALISILAGFAAPVAQAQDAAADGVHCSDAACSDGQQVLMRVRTRGERAPVAGEAATSSSALQPDRRVTVETEATGKAVAIGKWSVQLPNGGVVWATEDPALGQPEFNVTAPSLVAFEGGRIVKPVQFYARSNYSAFIDHAEVLVFRASDVDLIAPIATIPLPVAAVAQATWDGALPDGGNARPGDELVYILRAYGADGSFDETWPHRLQLVKPEEVERGQQLLRDSVEKQYGLAMGVEDAERRSLVDEAFHGNGLRLQNIPIYGSRIRILGRNLPQGATVKINGEPYPVDLQGKLGAEFLEPVGNHRFDLEIGGSELPAPIRHTLDVDVSGKYLFAVALADVTLSGNHASGSLEPLADAGRYDDDLIVDGRLAFYLKGKARGKYLVTAQADTREREVSELFHGFWKADLQDIFRRLDPDQYYPVYGDDSTTYRDVDTMGRLYLRVDWDKSQALWGNYDTGLTGTEYAQYSRALYGGALSWRSRGNNAWGDPSSEVKAFGSEAQTAPGHGEFLGTGGSLYYLRDTDILPGSERVAIEWRDATTGRVQKRSELQPGADYQIDAMQGRIILSNALATIASEDMPRITRDAPLDGFNQVLLVDYEYIPQGFDSGSLTAGVRAKHWFGDHIGVGVTYVDENRAGDDYTLAGADLTLQAGRGTYLKLEHSRTESTSAPVFFSDNGGLSFTQLNSGVAARREGDADSIEARANFRELGWTKLDWSAAAWKRRVDAGYSIARYDLGERVDEYGAEVFGQFAPNFSVYARYSRAERGDEALTQAQISGEWRITDADTLTAELRRVEERRSATDNGTGTLAAVKYLHRFGSTLDLYGIAQATLDDDHGRYRDNNAFTVGAKYLFGELSSVGAEVTAGDRGNAATVNAEYRLTRDHSLYGSYTWSPDQTDADPLFNADRQQGWTLGQRWRLSNQVNLFNESQFLKTPQSSGLAHTFGMDFYPAVGWNAGFNLQKADLDSALGEVQRRAISVSGGRTSTATQWQSKLEWREDSGAEQRRQWVTANTLTHKFNESFRIAARLNWSDTDDRLDPNAGAKFVEANAGFAWRPWNSTRWALFGRYTYLYDVSTLAQDESIAFYDQRSKVLSLEGVFHPAHDWEFAGKLARREGEVRMGRMTGEWADSGATFAAAQVRYGITTDWNLLGEVRWLGVDDGGDKRGLLFGVDRDIGRNFRIGIGYNFTDFSDDLTDFDYDHRGWFLNLVGRY